MMPLTPSFGGGVPTHGSTNPHFPYNGAARGYGEIKEQLPRERGHQEIIEFTPLIMKTHTILALTSFTLSCGLMADEPAHPERADIQPKPAPEAIPQTALGGKWHDRKMPSASVGSVLTSAKQLWEAEAKKETIQSILQHKEAKTTLDKLKAPIVLKSKDDAAKHLTPASVKKIKVDFTKEQVVIFAWQGSGQDELSGTHRVGPAHGDHPANFQYVPGRTKDLKTHSAIFRLPKGSKIIVQ